MSFWAQSQQQQPGSKHDKENVDQNGVAPTSPASRQKMEEKRSLRDLNQRLEIYISKQKKNQQTVESLKNALAKQEIEFRNRIREKENQYNQINEKLRTENESLQYQTKQLNEELQTFENANSDLQQRVASSEKRASEKESEIEALRHQITLFSNEVKSLRSENADIKYKYENHDNERKTLLQQFKQLKEKNSHLMKDLTKRQSENRSQCEAFNRLLNEKRSENDRLIDSNRLLMSEKDQIQDKLRNEFDSKLKEFVSKREEQYKQEKEEWMRIFKQEFNRKLRSYKDANLDLSNNNNKLEEEIIDLQSRISKLKQIKTEMELTLRNNEEEMDRLRTNVDTLRKSKDIEIKQKCQLIAELKEQKKQRDIEFDEVVGIKIQLSQEIELYQRILSEAEESAGYDTPMGPNTRKKRKLNMNNMVQTNGFLTETPGIVRGAQLARQDLSKIDTNSKNGNENDTDFDNDSQSQCNGDDVDTEIEETDNENDNEMQNNNNNNSSSNSNNNNNKFGQNRNKNVKLGQKRHRNNMYMDSNDSNDNEFKDCESNDAIVARDGLDGPINGRDGRDGATEAMDGSDSFENTSTTTPGGEAWPLQFSTMDLTRSMIEIQNISDSPVSLRGYTLSNCDGSALFPLPNDRVLAMNEKLRVMIGLRAKLGNDCNESTILWKADVWTGDEDDVARLYDPNNNEIARIDITPDMLPKDKQNTGNCYVM